MKFKSFIFHILYFNIGFCYNKNMDELRVALADDADEKYREFNKKIIPSKRPFVGVKIPKIREIIDKIPTSLYAEILNTSPVTVEEVLARGMIIAKLPYAEMVKNFDSQVEIIDDWCTCDTFCSAISKSVKKHRAEFLRLKLIPLFNSDSEFDIRVGLVLLKCAYMEPEYLELIFEYAENFGDKDEYYIKMAIAWLLSECFIKFPKPTLKYLKNSKLPKWTFNKTISKIRDSYRVDIETKTELKKLRK